uniref:Fibronectin type-III domain-containing protein n=1 Tax=Denticeps clupeoides TaxID=299321 RepID=A0AAY4CAW9_9TELE
MKLRNVTVEIWEEIVIVRWEPPEDCPEDASYAVRIGRSVSLLLSFGRSDSVIQKFHIFMFTHLYSYTLFLSQHITSKCVTFPSLLHTPFAQFSISFANSNPPAPLLQTAKILPPSFSLAGNGDSIKVKIHSKPTLMAIFTAGLQYSAYLRIKGHVSKVLSVEDIDQVTMPMKTTKAPRLPHGDTVFGFVGLALGILVMVVLLGMSCFLWRPVKMPAVLKPQEIGWHPVSITDGPVEVIVDKGWLLTRTLVDGKKGKYDDTKKILEEVERRESQDSGINMEPASISSRHSDEEEAAAALEDSGCESLDNAGGSLNGSGGSRELLLMDGRRGDDSGLGLGLNGGGHGVLPDLEVVAGDGYRSQSPATIESHAYREEKVDVSSQCDTDTNLAAPISGYRPSQVIGNELTNACHHMPSVTIKQDFPLSSYLKKTVLQTVRPLEQDDHIPLFQDSLMSCNDSALFHNDRGLDCHINSIAVSLSDMELTFG